MNWEESNMVEWKKLEEVCTLERGVRVVRKNLLENGQIPVFQNSLTPLGYFGKSNYPAHTPFVICAGAAGEIGYSNVPFWAADDCTCVKCNSSVIGKYAYYYLLVKQHALKSQVRKASVPRLSKNVIEKIIIPVLSIEEQKRIVGILDTFTSSIDNLKKQIVHRKKQLEQYRNELLDLEGHEGVSMRPLGELCEIIRGNGVQKTDFTEEGVGCIHYGQIYTHYGLFTYTTNKFVSEATAAKAKKASKGDIIMTSTSENVEDVCKSVAYLGEDDIVVSSHALILKHNLDPKYLAHCTATYNFFKQKYKLAHGAKVVEIKPEEVAKIKIPVVAKPGQYLIVFILDKFEAIIANLEKQLELRQKQYEYYRNELLTFE